MVRSRKNTLKNLVGQTVTGYLVCDNFRLENRRHEEELLQNPDQVLRCQKGTNCGRYEQWSPREGGAPVDQWEALVAHLKTN